MRPALLRSRRFSALAFLILVMSGDPSQAAVSELDGYLTTREAKTAVIKPGRHELDGQLAYLGVTLETDATGIVTVGAVASFSPAIRAGLRQGDRLLSVEGRNVRAVGDLRECLRAKEPGDTLTLEVERQGRAEKISATLEATSRPVILGERAILGVSTGLPTDQPGLDIRAVTQDKPAARAGLRVGDRILAVEDQELGESRNLSDALLEKKPGDSVKIVYRRGSKDYRKNVTLAADDPDAGLPPEERRDLTTWKKPMFRLAVICVEFPDAKHNARIPREEWERAYFSRDTYRGTNATSQAVHGSMADYYHEVSYGKFRVEGKVFDWVEAPKKRLEYNVPSRSKWKVEFMNEIVGMVRKRDGADALSGCDGLAFIYAGAKPPEVLRSSILWAHRSSVRIGDKSWPYVIVSEGGERMSNISTMCHEFGHILGLPDLYARPENPGSEGAGVWTVMSNQARNGRPQHFCAWSKEQLGWLNPVVIDPRVKQKLILGPVADGDRECYKVLVRPDGSEYLLLENRRRTGFDASLPAEGLLIWRVVANRPILEEAHGVAGPAGPRVFLPGVPWPGRNNHSFTPYTTPSSRSLLGGGLPVHLSNIRQLADGRITFEIGYEYD